MDEEQQLPSPAIVLAQVVAERETMNAHAESLDGKAGVVLGFAGVLVGLGATAQITISGTVIFEIGLAVAVVAAILAATRSRPEPPPFRPNKDLIGYIEKGQKPPARPAPPSEKR